MKPNMYAAQNSGQKAWNRLFDRSACPEDLLLLAKADHRGRINAAPYAETERTIRARLSAYEEMMARPHITGADLLARGIQPGEKMGRKTASFFYMGKIGRKQTVLDGRPG